MSKNKQPPGSLPEPVAKKPKITPARPTTSSVITSAAITSTSATTSSSRPSDPIEARFVALCEANPDGVTEAQLNREFTDITLHELGALINKILKQQRLKVFHTENQQMIYKLVNSADAEKFRGLGAEDMLIYQLIEQSGNMGIWIRDIRKRANLQAPKAGESRDDRLNKIIKLLLTKKLIKSEKSIAGKNKKVFMLYHLEPAKEVTGGAFYSGHEFDTDFTDALYQACLKCFRTQGKGSVEGVTDYVHKLGVFKVNISSTDIAAILSSMSYDGVIERMAQPFGDLVDRKKPKLSDIWYKHVRAGPLTSGYTHIPCSVCPVADKCTDGGQVSPQSCLYLRDWMEF